MQIFEINYARLIEQIMGEGAVKQTRNGPTKSLFGMSLEVDNLDKSFPILQGRKMYPKGVMGELAAMLRCPTKLSDFEEWGCNYWSKWAKPDGSINVDYGNAWHANGQIERLKDSLLFNPNDRRMIINGWRPENLDTLDLPCCHYSYQFYVAKGVISMVWTQRSVDMLIGLPSDIVFGAAWLISIANEFGLKPGKIKFDLGDCHVYQEHNDGAYEYMYRVLKSEHEFHRAPTYRLNVDKGVDFCQFEPKHIVLSVFDSLSPIKFELKA